MRGLPQDVRQCDGDREQHTGSEPGREECAPLREQQQRDDDGHREQDNGVLALDRDAEDRTYCEPPAGIGSLDDAQNVQRRQRPEPEPDGIG